MLDTSREIMVTAPVTASIPLESDIEIGLSEEIDSLWRVHQDSKAIVRRSKEELKVVRCNLGQRLHEMKALLAHTGRSGGWAAYLRSHSLPRATADRYVRKHETSLIAPNKRITEAIPDATQEDIRHLVRSLLPRLRRLLITPESISVFMDELGQQLLTIDGSQTGKTPEAPSLVKVRHDQPGLNAGVTV